MESVPEAGEEALRWLLIDSCGAVATLAVGRGGDALAQCELVGRELSANWPGALRTLLLQSGLQAAELEVIGVLDGPGSFTGVRVGLALAKGLCESLGAKLVAMSRLQVLQGDSKVVALLDAGRGDWYMRQGSVETLADAETVRALGDLPVAALPESEAVLVSLGLRPVVRALTPLGGLPLLLTRSRVQEFADLPSADANYVREARTMYASGLLR